MISRRKFERGTQNTRSGGKILESNRQAKTSFRSRNLRARELSDIVASIRAEGVAKGTSASFGPVERYSLAGSSS
jgi:hypothetical protein